MFILDAPTAALLEFRTEAVQISSRRALEFLERTEQFPCAGRVDAGTFKVSDSVLLISNVFCGFFSLAGGRHQAIHKR